MQKLRKAIASIGLVAMLSTLVVSTTAFAFDDVSSGDWFSPYVDELVDAGVVDGTKDNFRPNDSLNRAEALKMAVEACGVSGTTSIDFADVSESDWFYSYVQTGVANAIIDGSKANFNPSQPVNRAEFLKMGIEACELPSATTDESWSDVATSDWFYTYVATGYEWTIVDGYSDGTFRPGNAILRAEAAKVTSNVMNPVPREDAPTGPEVPGTQDGDVTVEISDDTPESNVVPRGASNVPFTTFTVTANDGDAELDEMVVRLYNVSETSNYAGVYLYHEDGTRLTNKKSVNSESREVTFTNLNLLIEDGDSVDLTVRADLSSTYTSTSVGQFGIASASKVVLEAGDVSGDFPLRGNEMSLSTVDAGSVEIDKNGTVTNPTIGSVNHKIAEFRVQTTNEDAILRQINLTVKGSIAEDDLSNLVLKDIAGTELATTDGISRDSLAVMVFDEGYSIAEGNQKVFRLFADVTGDVGDDIKVYIDEDTDVFAEGGDFGFGMSVDRGDDGGSGTYDGETCTSSSNPDCSYSTLEGGNVTFAFNGPVADDIALDGEDVHLLEFTLSAVNPITVQDLDVIVYGDDDSDNDPFDAVDDGTDNDDDGLIVGSGTNVASLTDIKIINIETGKTVMGPLELDGVTDSDDDADQTIDFTDDFDIDGGESLKLAVTADTDDAITAETYFGAAIDISGFSAEDSNGDDVATSDIVPSSDLTSNAMKVVAASLTASLSGTPVSDTFVKGTTLVPAAGVNLQAGDAEMMTLTDVTLQGYLDIDGDGYNDVDGTVCTAGQACDSAGGATATFLKDFVTSVYLYHDGVAIAGPEAPDNAGDVEFTDVNLEVDAGDTEKLTIMVDLAKPSGVSSDLIAFGVAAAGDFTVIDEEGASVTATITGNINTSQSVALTIEDNGTLSFTEEGSPDASIVIGGTDDQFVSKYKFNAVNEAFTVTDLELFLESDTALDAENAETTFARAVDAVSIKYEDVDGVEQTETSSFSSGEVTFAGLDFYVPKDGNAYVEIYVDLNTIQAGALSGDLVGVVINENTSTNDFEAVGAGSGNTLTISDAGTDLTLPTNEANIAYHYLRETQPTLSLASGQSTSFDNGNNTLYALQVEADSAEAVAMKQLRFKLSYTRNSDSSGGLGNFKFKRNSTDITDDVDIVSFGDSNVVDNQSLEASSTDGLPGTDDDSATSFDGYAVVTFNDSVTSEEVVSAGDTVVYYLEATASSVDNSSDSVSVYMEDDTYALSSNIAAVDTDFLLTRIYVGTDNGTEDFVAYDVNGDTAANNGSTCTNISDDIVLNGTAPADCDAITAATLSEIIVGTDNGSQDFVAYDLSGNTAANDGGACANVADDLVISGSAPADCDAVTTAAVAATAANFYLATDAGSSDFVGFDVSGNTVANSGSTCTSIGDDLSLGGSAPDTSCEIIAKEAASSLNFVWSDNSNTSHTTRTADWTNGYLVDDLDTDSLSLDF